MWFSGHTDIEHKTNKTDLVQQKIRMNSDPRLAEGSLHKVSQNFTYFQRKYWDNEPTFIRTPDKFGPL